MSTGTPEELIVVPRVVFERYLIHANVPLMQAMRERGIVDWQEGTIIHEELEIVLAGVDRAWETLCRLLPNYAITLSREQKPYRMLSITDWQSPHVLRVGPYAREEQHTFMDQLVRNLLGIMSDIYGCLPEDRYERGTIQFVQAPQLHVSILDKPQRLAATIWSCVSEPLIPGQPRRPPAFTQPAVRNRRRITL